MTNNNIHETANVHPTAIVHETAIIGANVEIGPYTIIGARVEIGENCLQKKYNTKKDLNSVPPFNFIRIIKTTILKFQEIGHYKFNGNENTINNTFALFSDYWEYTGNR